ncbi:MAG: DUF2341 domain-containing protein [Patescibacteria group bacterium]|nr:DUF2341 domain-containing protein [Patescibacteria group bacterium]
MFSKIKKQHHGFTITELMVATGIMVLLLGIVLINYREAGRQRSLSDEADRLASVLRQAQMKTLAGEIPAGQTERPAGGYGVKITSPSDRYILFADYDGDGDYDENEKIQETVLPKKVYIQSVVGGDEIIFIPPSGKISGPDCKITMALEMKTQGKIIDISSTSGQISLRSGEVERSSLVCKIDGVCEGDEAFNNCPLDCCESDCTAIDDTLCHQECDGIGGCVLRPACNGVVGGAGICLDNNTMVPCCSGTPIDCPGDQLCCSGACQNVTCVADEDCGACQVCSGTDCDATCSPVACGLKLEGGSDDGCCPEGCTVENDSDCAGLAGYKYRTPITINNNSDQTLTDYQVKIQVNYEEGKMQPDFDDIRFTQTTNTIELNYWRESYRESYAVFWVKVPELDMGDNQIYMYYGNEDVATISNGDLTFDFFDDFIGTNLAANWATNVSGGTITVANGQVTLASTSIVPVSISSAFIPTSPSFFIETKHKEGAYYRNRFYAATNLGGGSPIGFDYGYFYNGASWAYTTGKCYWNGTWNTTVNANTDYITRWLRTDGTDTAYNWYTINYSTGAIIDTRTTTNSSLIRYITIRLSEAANTSTIVDWVRVRKYANSEPIVNYNLENEERLIFECSDGIDNDGDGSVDNDGDGSVDLVDEGCESTSDDDESNCGDDVCEGNETFINCEADCHFDFTDSKTITITNIASQILTDYQVKVIVDRELEMQEDFGDIRFLNADETQFLSYWMESSGDLYAVFWVKVPQLNIGDNNIKMYYGDPDLTSESSVANTFIREIDGVVGAWDFDTAGSYADTSGNGNNGTCFGTSCPTWISNGMRGGAYSFDGADYVATNLNIDQSSGHTTTMCAWAYPTNPMNTDDLMSTDNSGWDWAIEGHYGLWRIADGGAYRSTGVSMNLNTWQYVCAVFGSSNTSFYKNGLAVYSTGVTPGYDASDNNFRIGMNPGGSSEAWYGSIDDALVFNRSLTANEILGLYNNYGYTTTYHPGKVLIRKYVNPEPIVNFYHEDFEHGFGRWTSLGGTPTSSEYYYHDGIKSYTTNENKDIIQTRAIGERVTVYFYDNASDAEMTTGVWVDDGITTVFLGVDTDSTLGTGVENEYVYRIGSWGRTNITRTTGWHKFEFDYSSGSGVVLKIDDIVVATSSAISSFNRILLGDVWDWKVSVGDVYFDDLTIE